MLWKECRSWPCFFSLALNYSFGGGAMAPLWRPEDSTWEPVLSVHHVGPGFPLTHFTRPHLPIFLVTHMIIWPQFSCSFILLINCSTSPHPQWSHSTSTSQLSIQRTIKLNEQHNHMSDWLIFTSSSMRREISLIAPAVQFLAFLTSHYSKLHDMNTVLKLIHFT